MRAGRRFSSPPPFFCDTVFHPLCGGAKAFPFVCQAFRPSTPRRSFMPTEEIPSFPFPIAFHSLLSRFASGFRSDCVRSALGRFLGGIFFVTPLVLQAINGKTPPGPQVLPIVRISHPVGPRRIKCLCLPPSFSKTFFCPKSLRAPRAVS